MTCSSCTPKNNVTLNAAHERLDGGTGTAPESVMPLLDAIGAASDAGKTADVVANFVVGFRVRRRKPVTLGEVTVIRLKETEGDCKKT